VIDIYNKKNMETFGTLKSKIENLLLQSYQNNTFKNELNNFKKYVLSNKNISEMYYLYDELSTNKGLSDNIAEEYISESINTQNLLKNNINKIDLKQIQDWVKNIDCKNLYNDIDILFTKNVLQIETKINSKMNIFETLKRKPKQINENVQIPLSSMINIANKTITKYIDDLTESDKKELINLLSEDDNLIKDKFNDLKPKTIIKLSSLLESENDKIVKNRLQETIEKIQISSYDKLGYYKLKNLYENI
jgi:hypothetical protein